MSEPSKHVHTKKESSTYEKILAHPIEKDKKNQQEAISPPHPQSLLLLFSSLTAYFKKYITLFSQKFSSPTSPGALQSLTQDLFEFRTLLVTLAGENTSHLFEFGESLSVAWDRLLVHCQQRPSSTDPAYPLFAKLLFFKQQVHHFPTGAEHPLGYYLSHHVGKGWIPFPFMELLSYLHEEFVASPTTSTLKKWILLLDDILVQKNFID